ncbi:MAG: hypothetical protein Kow0013_16230 [Pararhodobacter sp.]
MAATSFGRPEADTEHPIDGTDGDDTLEGGDGDDSLIATDSIGPTRTGGNGADQFIVGEGQTTIDDHTPGTDRIELRALRTDPEAPTPVFRYETGGSVVRLYVDDALQVTLTNVTAFDPDDVTVSVVQDHDALVAT